MAPLLAALAAVTGALLIVIGFIRRARASAARALPLLSMAEAAHGSLGFFEGLAGSPELLSFDTSGDCVFFIRVTEERQRDYGRPDDAVDDGATWRVVSVEQKGAFLLEAEGGRIAVIPAGAALTLSRSVAGGEDGFAAPIGARRWTARLLAPGTLASAAGTVRSAHEALAFLKERQGAGTPSAVISLLESSPDLPCLFADGGPFWVSDRTRDEVISGLEGDATLFMSCGGAALGLAALLLASSRF